MEYFEKIEQNPYSDIYWNIPEQKQGIVNIIGGDDVKDTTIMQSVQS